MSDTTPTTDDIVISMASEACGEVCQVGEFQWAPGPEIQEQLKQLSAEDRAKVMEKIQMIVHAKLSTAGALLLILEHGIDAFDFAAHMTGKRLLDDFDDMDKLFASVELASMFGGVFAGTVPAAVMDSDDPGPGIKDVLSAFLGGLDPDLAARVGVDVIVVDTREPQADESEEFTDAERRMADPTDDLGKWASGPGYNPLGSPFGYGPPGSPTR